MGRWCCSPSSSSRSSCSSPDRFKLTTLAGFVLIPFGLFGKTAFMAERVLGNVVSSGIRCWCLPSSSASARRCSPNSPPVSAVRPTIDDAMAMCSPRSPARTSASSRHTANGLVPAARNSAPGACRRHRLAAGRQVRQAPQPLAAGVASRWRAPRQWRRAAARGGQPPGGGDRQSLGAGQSGASAVASPPGNVEQRRARAVQLALKRAAVRRQPVNPSFSSFRCAA